MATINITKTELVRPDKYNEDGTLKEVPRVNLPFQVIETVNESRATREAKSTAACRHPFSTSTKATRAIPLRMDGRTSSYGATTC